VGLVEVRGLTGAIGAADVMAKAAPVSLAGPLLIGDGLVTIVCRGDIAAVNEAVAAGSEAASQQGSRRPPLSRARLIQPCQSTY